jgi:acetyltransferase EpsM
MKLKEIYICGNGGLAKVVTDIIKNNDDYKILGYIDIKESKKNNITSFKDFIKNTNKKNVVIAIGENITRKKVYENLKKNCHYFPNIISKKAIISKNCKLGSGNIIMPNAVINTNSKIDNFNILNTSSIVEHDCKISSFVTLSPGAIICGGCNLKEGVFLGSNSTTIENLDIDKWAVVGAGSTAIINLGKLSLNIGNPTKIIRKLNKDYKVFK